MTTILMEIKNGNRRLRLYDMVPFKEHFPWIDRDKWSKLSQREKESHYNNQIAKHHKKLARVVRLFMKP